MIRYLGVLNDPSLAPAGIHDRSAIIMFESLAQAERTLYDAYLGRFFPSDGRALDGSVLLDTPGMSRSEISLTLWKLDGDGSPSDIRHDPYNCWEVLHEVEAYPDFEMTITKRAAIKRTPC